MTSASAAHAVQFTDLLPPAEAGPTLSSTQRARTVGASVFRGLLSTLREGEPFAAPVDFVLNEGGEPVFILREGSQTHSNVGADPRASLAITEERPDGEEGAAVTLGGEAVPLPEQEFAQSHVDFLNVHPIARECIAAGGLAFYKLRLTSAYLHGPGESETGEWLPVEGYATATVDALAPCSRQIMDAVSASRGADLRAFCAAFFQEEVGECEVVDLDELGFAVKVRSPAGMPPQAEVRRVAFREPVKTEQEARSIFVKLFYQAWASAEDEAAPVEGGAEEGA